MSIMDISGGKRSSGNYSPPKKWLADKEGPVRSPRQTNLSEYCLKSGRPETPEQITTFRPFDQVFSFGLPKSHLTRSKQMANFVCNLLMRGDQKWVLHARTALRMCDMPGARDGTPTLAQKALTVFLSYSILTTNVGHI